MRGRIDNSRLNPSYGPQPIVIVQCICNSCDNFARIEDGIPPRLLYDFSLEICSQLKLEFQPYFPRRTNMRRKFGFQTRSGSYLTFHSLLSLFSFLDCPCRQNIDLFRQKQFLSGNCDSVGVVMRAVFPILI